MKYISSLALLILISVGVLYIVQVNDAEELENLSVEYAKDGMMTKELKVVNEGNEVLYKITIEELTEYAHNNWNIFEEPPEVAMRPVSPDNFHFFDRSASISPNNEKLVFSVHDYAALTEMSFVVVANINTGELSMVKEPVMGSIEKFIWSPDSKSIAYILGTARANGDFLSVDDIESMEKRFTLSEKDLLEVFKTTHRNGDGFMPHFGNLRWEEEKLFFTTNSTGKETVYWSIDKSGENLKIKDK